MKMEMKFHNQTYKILMIERDSIVSEKEIERNLLGIEWGHLNYQCYYEVKDYRLLLSSLEIIGAKGYRAVLQESDNDRVSQNPSNEHESLMLTNYYSGSIIIGRRLITKEYQLQDYINPCFSYEDVIELIFSQGILVTSIDHSKAMKRIRMNLKCGYRTIKSKKDIHCIYTFLKETFIGDYKKQLQRQAIRTMV